MAATKQSTDFTLTLNEGERAELLILLEREVARNARGGSPHRITRLSRRGPSSGSCPSGLDRKAPPFLKTGLALANLPEGGCQ